MKANRQSLWRRKSAAPGSIGKMRGRAGKKEQARLLVADTGGDRMRARRIMQQRTLTARPPTGRPQW